MLPLRWLTNSSGRRTGSNDWISGNREVRSIRDRQVEHSRAMDRSESGPQPVLAARLLVQVYNGGSMASTAEKVYFTHPVLVAGEETEGGTATETADTTTTVPIIVLWRHPSAGEYLTAYSAGGRWVSERNSSNGNAAEPCMPCNIPLENLMFTWTNTFAGTNSTTMVYSGGLSPTWTTGCVDGNLKFQLSCNPDGGIELWAYFFISGGCPDGTSNYCWNLRADPVAIQFPDYDCSSFSLTFAFTDADPGCPTIYSAGTTQVTVTL